MPESIVRDWKDKGKPDLRELSRTELRQEFKNSSMKERLSAALELARVKDHRFDTDETNERRLALNLLSAIKSQNSKIERLEKQIEMLKTDN